MGWPKGKPRGPKKPKVEAVPETPKVAQVTNYEAEPVVATPLKHPELQSGPAIFGYRVLVNRTSETVEFMYNGKPFKVETELLLPTEIAYHGMRRTLVKWNPATNTYTCKLGIRGETDCSPISQEEANPLELLERTNLKEHDPVTGQPLRMVYESAPGNREKVGRLAVSGGPELSFGIKG